MTKHQEDISIDLIGIKARYLTADARFRTMMFNHLVSFATALQGEVELKQYEKQLAQAKAVRLKHDLDRVRAFYPEPNWSYSDIEE